MSRRLHQWMYGLIYPAVLGTMLVQSLVDPVSASSVPLWWWAPLILGYFVMGYGEGALRSRHYAVSGFVLDLGELSALLLAFVAIGRFDPADLDIRPNLPLLGFALAIAFLLPAIRHAVSRGKQARPRRARMKLFSLALAGMAAAIAVALGWQGVGWVMILVLMTVYVGVAIQPKNRAGASD